jgi:hypothetical protein
MVELRTLLVCCDLLLLESYEVIPKPAKSARSLLEMPPSFFSKPVGVLRVCAFLALHLSYV